MCFVTFLGSSMYLLLLSATASPVGPSRASVCRSSAVSAVWEGSPRLILALPWYPDVWASSSLPCVIG